MVKAYIFAMLVTRAKISDFYDHGQEGGKDPVLSLFGKSNL